MPGGGAGGPARLAELGTNHRHDQVVDVRFITQPFSDGEDLRDFLEDVAGDTALTTLRVVVAWAKRSGVGRIEDALGALRARGGRFLVIVGISEGGGTRQGLERILAVADEAHVFHDAGRTFHPKVYMASGDSSAKLLVGSHNLTVGGLAWNYEAGLICELDLTRDEDAALHRQVVDYFDRLRDDDGVCLELNSDLLARLLEDAGLRIQDEDTRARFTRSEHAPEDTDSLTEGADDIAATVFGRSAERKRGVPPLPPQGGTRQPARPRGEAQVSPGSATDGGVGPALSASPNHRWFKVMDGTAAQRPPGPASHATGNLRLSQEQFAIDHKRYFRQVFFGGMPWVQRASDSGFEDLVLPMHVAIAEDDLGVIKLSVSHAEHRVSGQGNVPTVLHWGSRLSKLLRDGNYVGFTVTLERYANGECRLVIARHETGPFLY